LENGDEDLKDTLNDDHKLSYRGGNVDGVELVEGDWWTTEGDQTIHYMSLEDREARRMGVGIGEQISYEVAGKALTFTIAAIHRQGIADVAPNVVTVRTARILASARDLLGQATNGLMVVAIISFLASLLVLFSVIAASRVRQVYDASVLNALGVRLSVIRKSLYFEFLLIALVTALFAVILGSAIALPLLEWRMKLPSTDLIWLGLFTAIIVSITTYRRMNVKPAILLRNTL